MDPISDLSNHSFGRCVHSHIFFWYLSQKLKIFFSFTATAYGEGVYFAVNANYAVQNTFSRPDGQGHRRVYLCKVLTGEYTVGKGGMRVPPQKPGQQPHILYDSVVNDVGDMNSFVIFNDSQCYPAYLITVK